MITITNKNFTFNLLSSCTQRSLQSKYNIPPPRLETTAIPAGYTLHQLSMRRKAEILKYSSNKQSTQTNSLTKAEKWAQIVKNPRIYANQKLLETCEKDGLIYTPTSSSDVPGKVMNLYNDESVPLYNYMVKTDAYSKIPPELSTSPYDIKGDSTIIFKNGEENTLVYIIMRNPKQTSYLIDFSVPFNVYFEFTGLTPNTIYDISFNITPHVNIYYSADVVCSNNQSILQTTVPTVNNITASFIFQPTSSSYILKQTIGNLNFGNITLSAYAGYTYQLTLKLNVSDISFNIKNGNQKTGNENYYYYFLGGIS